MVKEIDVRGLSCPEPLILAKKAVDAGETAIRVTADDPVARDNIRRMAANAGYAVAVSEQDGDIVLDLTRS